MFIWVSAVAFIFGSSQLPEGSLKFTFVCGYVDKKTSLGWLLAFFTSNYWNGKRIKEALFFFWKNLVYLQYLKKRLKWQTVFKFLGKFYF